MGGDPILSDGVGRSNNDQRVVPDRVGDLDLPRPRLSVQHITDEANGVFCISSEVRQFASAFVAAEQVTEIAL
jgi:hypothetical protein